MPAVTRSVGAMPLALLPVRNVGRSPAFGVIAVDEPPSADFLSGQVASPDLALNGEPGSRRVSHRRDFGSSERAGHATNLRDLPHGEQVGYGVTMSTCPVESNR